MIGHRIITGFALAAAIIAGIMAFTTQSRVNTLERKAHDQEIISRALANLAVKQGDLLTGVSNNQLALTKGVRMLLPGRHLTGRAP